MTERIFDAYLVVDWSAASKPNTGLDSIWLGWLEASSGNYITSNPATRDEALELVVSLLTKAVSEDKRILVGFDFAYGYPKGTSSILNLQGVSPWKTMWRKLTGEITDSPGNENNRFEVAADLNKKSRLSEGPFWGCPASKASDDLSTKKPSPWSDIGVAERRSTENRTSSAQPVWKLFYTGAVGSQSLMGIPRLSALLENPQLKQHSVVWPFQTGMKSPLQLEQHWNICHAEIYPSLIEVNPLPGQVKDEAQVIQLAQYFRGLDLEEGLGELFEQPSNIDSTQLADITEEEGWILGVR
jgi:precorrin-8X/cobalt-precorrin-8 methylmutase